MDGYISFVWREGGAGDREGAACRVHRGVEQMALNLAAMFLIRLFCQDPGFEFYSNCVVGGGVAYCAMRQVPMFSPSYCFHKESIHV